MIYAAYAVGVLMGIAGALIVGGIYADDEGITVPSGHTWESDDKDEEEN